MKRKISTLSTSAICLALLLIALETSSQLLLKIGLTQLGEFPTHTIEAVLRFIAFAALNPYVVGAILCIVCSFITWLTLLSKIDLSIAHPITSLVLVTIVLSAHFLLNEPLNFVQMFGVICIVIGVFVVSEDANQGKQCA
jgi:drug/metabolite transporter (DMT)-like permease